MLPLSSRSLPLKPKPNTHRDRDLLSLLPSPLLIEIDPLLWGLWLECLCLWPECFCKSLPSWVAEGWCRVVEERCHGGFRIGGRGALPPSLPHQSWGKGFYCCGFGRAYLFVCGCLSALLLCFNWFELCLSFSLTTTMKVTQSYVAP